MPIGRINGEALDRAQQIVVRNAKRAEAARARYQRMTPDQRKSYNQKRYTPKRRSGNGEMGGMPGSNKKEEMDVLTTLEREVMKRTQQAQQVDNSVDPYNLTGSETTTRCPSGAAATTTAAADGPVGQSHPRTHVSTAATNLHRQSDTAALESAWGSDPAGSAERQSSANCPRIASHAADSDTGTYHRLAAGRPFMFVLLDRGFRASTISYPQVKGMVWWSNTLLRRRDKSSFIILQLIR